MKRALRKCIVDNSGEEWDELLPYVAMGYRMSKQKAVGYSPYFLMFGRDPIFQSRLQQSQEEVLDLDTNEEELRAFLDRRGQAFKLVMPLAIRKFAIAQQRDIERYCWVRGGGWDRPKASFASGDYVMIRQVKDMTLEPSARPHVLRIVEIRPSGAVVMEGSDAAR